MGKRIEIKPIIRKAGTRHFEALIQLWEASVRATHHFLTEEDRVFYRSFLPAALSEAEVFYMPAPHGNPAGFIGIAGDKIEMLFIHPSVAGTGLGTRLIEFAIRSRHASKVDVNEQNTQALAFYRKRRFEVRGRDAKDDCGKPYPILHMELKEQEVASPGCPVIFL